jgi:HlyD family secretion protein
MLNMLNQKKKIVAAGLIIAGVLLILLLIRFFSAERIGPGSVAPREAPGYPHAAVAEAIERTVTESFGAVGTIIPRTQAHIEAQVAAQVTTVLVQVGQTVDRGQTLVRLEDDRLNAQLSQARQSLQMASSQREQARQAVHAAEAAFAEAESAYSRVKRFFDAQAATQEALEQAQSRFLQARAGLQRAREGFAGAEAGVRQANEMVQEAHIALRYTQIKAPQAGKILRRMVDPGDMAMPGKPLLLLSTEGGMQLEAHVRESLFTRVRVGDQRQVRLSALDTAVDAVIDEIVPFIDPVTRTFVVKADLPDVQGAHPGMYGKLMIPYAEASVVLIPRAAVQQVGQLELVTVQTEAGWQRRYIKTGDVYDDHIEVLSGLSGGEVVLLREPAKNGR